MSPDESVWTSKCGTKTCCSPQPPAACLGPCWIRPPDLPCTWSHQQGHQISSGTDRVSTLVPRLSSMLVDATSHLSGVGGDGRQSASVAVLPWQAQGRLTRGRGAMRPRHCCKPANNECADLVMAVPSSAYQQLDFQAHLGFVLHSSLAAAFQLAATAVPK